METIYDEEDYNSESTVSNTSYRDRAASTARSTSLPIRKRKGVSTSTSHSWRPISNILNPYTIHPTPNDTVPQSPANIQHPMKYSNLKDPTTNLLARHEQPLATPPYSPSEQPLYYSFQSISSDKQETRSFVNEDQHSFLSSNSSFMEFLQEQRNRSRRSSLTSEQPRSSSDDSIDLQVASTIPSPSQKISTVCPLYNADISAPIPIQITSTPPRQQWQKAPTPPPSLLSPSLTTTKVSHSLSTGYGITGSSLGSIQSHIAKSQSESSAKSLSSIKKISPMTSIRPSSTFNDEITEPHVLKESLVSTLRSNIPTSVNEANGTSPIHCRCAEHYRYALLSTIVPMPLDKCFEWLYSSRGLGSGEHLIRKAHNIVNSSSHIDISPWKPPQSKGHDFDSNEWEENIRQLHYSVTYKIPMLAKTSTACNETQEILEYNSHAIRLHSESMTPNVLYGDLFSTVNQICMTQESTGMTRIKCFAEVKFKKSILWSSRIEASAMEGCGLYYKELLRQLLEIDSLNSLETHVVRPIVVRSNTADNSHPNQLLHPPTITANSTCVNTTKYQATTAVMRRSFSHGSISTSPAHSLLSQHYMRNSSATFTSTQGATALVDFSAKKFTENSESVSLSAVNKSVTTIWTRIIQFSTDMLSKPLSTATTITQEQHIEPTSLEIEDQGDTKSNTGETQTSATLIIPDDVVALPSDVSKMPIKKLIHSEDCTNASSTFVQVCDSSPTKSEVQEKNRILWLIFVIVMAMSVMNLWQLFRTVSSIADIMHNNYQDRLLTTKPVRQLDWKTNFAYRPSQGSVQRETTQFHLMPLQIQADILRTEMEDLMFVLQTIKTLYT